MGTASAVASSVASHTRTQLYRSSERTGMKNLSGSAATSAARSSFGNPNPMDFSSREFYDDSLVAHESLARLKDRFPVAITRDLNKAREWIKRRARGTERYGLIASSRALRLKPYAIDVRVSVDPVHWFLNGPNDTRSSYYLEDCATEFQVQGLELDWACVTWDGDLRYCGSKWTFHDFRGDRWQNVKNADNQIYLRNAYRVLLTRARQGMIIFVPPGESTDPTRSPAYYDCTFNYLSELGVPTVSCSLMPGLTSRGS